MSIRRIKQESQISLTNLQFSTAEEIIPIHLFRYNSTINQLIKTKEIDESEVDGEIVTWDDFWKARNNKIRAYSDCINTLIQKEELLKFHNREFQIEINAKEKISLNLKPNKYDFSILPLNEQVDLLKLVVKTKETLYNAPISIIQTNSEVNSQQSTPTPSNKEGGLNIDLIRQETVTEVFQTSINRNPTARLQEALMRIAAIKFKDAGATLDESEEKMID